MAANKFATMLHRNTNMITLILIYAVLEWILILLLLLNSLFSYLIIKFADYFGLKPPCLWCTRLDPENGNKNMHRDLLCEVHAKEISKLGYCSNHHKLAESPNMCEDCLPESHNGFSKSTYALFPLMKEFGVIQNHTEMVGENGEVSYSCSCCGVSLDNNIYSSYILLKTSSWDFDECAKKENLIMDKNRLGFGAGLCDDVKVLEDKNERGMLLELDEAMEKSENGTNDNSFISVFVNEKEDEGLEIEDKMETLEEKTTLIMEDEPLEFFLDYSGERLVQVELIDWITEDSQSKDNVLKIEDHENVKKQGLNMGSEIEVEERENLVITEEPNYAMLESMEMEEDENSLIFHAKDHCDLVIEEFEQFTTFHVSQFPSEDVADVKEMAVEAREMHNLEIHTACEELARVENNISETQNQESPHAYECSNEDHSTCFANILESDYHDPMKVVESQSLSVHDRELYEIEENKSPDTPKSIDSLNHLHQKFPFLDKSNFATDESLEGSLMSELEGSDGVDSLERLKSALRAERKTLQVLYAELEEERSASAEAANQTMAMINRLHEEKAAFQMEAFQYQRMMEEQSEYDQNALQLMNELMVKREKELEMCRMKLLDYERKEKMRLLRKSNGSTRTGFSSASCSNTSDDNDGLSVDLNQEAKDEKGFYIHEELGNFDTPIDAVMDLEEFSLVDFEERLSILQHLEVLEEKLVTLNDDDERLFEDVRAIEDLHEERNGHANGNGFVNEMNGKHHQQRRIAGQRGKTLLPLSDAICDDEHVDGNGFDSNQLHDHYVKENKNPAIEEEVDHLYERLQALEADREFLSHCFSALKKGDKGMDLLKEILQHLRDLRNLELHLESLSNSSLL